MDGLGDPRHQQWLALRFPFKCFQLWQGLRRPCIANLSEKQLWKGKKRNHQLSQKGLQKTGDNLRVRLGVQKQRVEKAEKPSGTVAGWTGGVECLAFKLSCAFKLKQSGQERQDR